MASGGIRIPKEWVDKGVTALAGSAMVLLGGAVWSLVSLYFEVKAMHDDLRVLQADTKVVQQYLARLPIVTNGSE